MWSTKVMKVQVELHTWTFCKTVFGYSSPERVICSPQLTNILVEVEDNLPHYTGALLASDQRGSGIFYI